MYRQASYINRMLNAGACSYVLKDDKVENIKKAIHSAYKGVPFFSEEVRSVLQSQKQKKNMMPPITTREKEVLNLVAQGLTTKEIAAKLFISTNTVQTHRKHLIEKFNASNSTAMLNSAKDLGLI
jgi:DNA-binding NarL/FixJ family response regulator